MSAFTALAQLLKGIAPALTGFAQAFSAVFTVLENTGIFATLGDALENLAAPLAKLISALLNGLTPILPPVIGFISQLSTIMVNGLTNAIGAVLPPLTQLVTVALQTLAQILPVILPVLTKVFALFTQGVVDAISGIAKALAAIINAIPPSVLGPLVDLAATLLILKKTGVISLGFKLVGLAQKLWSWLTGGTVDIAAGGMQTAGDTMAAAAEAMQKAADTMAGAAGEGAGAGEAAAGAGAAEAGAATGASLFATLAAPLFGVAAGAALALYLKKYESQDHPAPATQQGPRGTNFNQGNSATAYKQYDQAVTQATSDLASLQKAAGQVTADFTRQQQAAGQASQALSGYDAAVQKYGSGSSQAATAAEQLITDLENAGVNAGRAGDDVNTYTTAVTDNGLQSTQAQAARQQLVADILNASNNAQQGRTDLADYTTAVQDNGAKSQAAQSARARLIQDLENAGLNAQTATGLVNNLGTAIKDLPSSKTVTIHMDGSGLYTITGSAVAASQGAGGSGNAAGGLAAGGMIAQGTTGTADDVPIMASKGEYVVKASSVSKYGTGMMDAINAGNFAAGGLVGNLTPGYISGMYGDFQNQMTAAMVSAMRAAIKAAQSAAEATASGSTKTGAGDYTYAQLQALWIQAGGNPAAAANMAKIAIAESGGNPNAYNASGATGLWQILGAVVGGNLYDPLVNARNAVAKYNANGYYPWISDPVAAGLIAQGITRAQGGPIGGYAFGGLIGGGFPGWPGGGPGSWLGGLQGMMSGASGGSANPLAGTAFVGNYTGVVSPASGGFGITAQQLGLPPPAAAPRHHPRRRRFRARREHRTSSAASTTATPVAAAPAAPSLNAAQKAAVAVLENLMGGLIRDNKTGEAAQANALLNSVGVTKYNHQLSQISFLDSQLAKAKSKGAKTAAEKLLESFGVHVFTPQGTAKGNAPKSAVITKMESLVKAAITANNMTGAGQANSILTALGTGKYTSELSAISHLDSLLAQYKAKKDTKDITATETLLKQFGVKHFAQGGTLWEPVVGFGTRSGGAYAFAEHGPETVTPGAQGGGGDMVSELRALRGQMDKLIQTTASVPHGVTSGIGSALGGAAQSASFAQRYPRGG